MAVHLRFRCRSEPTRTVREETLTLSVWISLAGTPTARIARTTAPVPRLAAESAARELTPECVTETDRSATSGVINTEAAPSTLSVLAVVSAPAADAGIKTTAMIAPTAHTHLRISLPSSELPTQAIRPQHAPITLAGARREHSRGRTRRESRHAPRNAVEDRWTSRDSRFR